MLTNKLLLIWTVFLVFVVPLIVVDFSSNTLQLIFADVAFICAFVFVFTGLCLVCRMKIKRAACWFFSGFLAFSILLAAAFVTPNAENESIKKVSAVLQCEPCHLKKIFSRRGRENDCLLLYDGVLSTNGFVHISTQTSVWSNRMSILNAYLDKYGGEVAIDMGAPLYLFENYGQNYEVVFAHCRDNWLVLIQKY